MRWFIYNINKYLINSNLLEEVMLTDKSCEQLSNKADVFIAIGGDNYCYNKGKMFFPTDRAIKRKGKKLILLGCSIEPTDIPGELAEHLKMFDLIIARETITQDALLQNGIHNVKLIPDSAFILHKESLPLHGKWKETEIVGINISPMILNYSKDTKNTLKNFYHLCDYILSSTKMNIALIPHVHDITSNDLAIMQVIFEKYKNTNRIIIHDDITYNAQQIKGYISRCRFMIAARTHASIAAYSTCVPTIVVGYSVKAKGIAKDIFGTYENYVLPVQSLKNEDDLTNAFKWLIQNEDSIRKHLLEFMPSYIEKVWQVGEEVKKLLED